MTDDMHDPSERSQVPVAKHVPSPRAAHGDTFVDPYDWMRDKQSPDLQRFVAEQNAYFRHRTKGIADLKRTLFEELKSRVKQTDMSVPTRIDGYWYFTRVVEGKQYAIQCRRPVSSPDDWDPPQVNAADAPGAMPDEQVVFDPNKESEGHDFFNIGGLDFDKTGRWMLYGVDLAGNERYDYRIRDLKTESESSEVIEGAAAGACLTPDGRWVFYVMPDDAWRPYLVLRHRVGTPVRDDVEVFREPDERFAVDVGMSFDERDIVISVASKTTSEVLMLPADEPEGVFTPFIRRREGIEYDVSFARFEADADRGSGSVDDPCLGDDTADGKLAADIPLALVFHNARNPNFEVDVIDLNAHKPPYTLDEGVVVAQGSPYGCRLGDAVEPGASTKPINTAYRNGANPAILRDMRGLVIEGIGMYRHFVVLSYRAESLPHIAVMTKAQALADFQAGRPWNFREVKPVGDDVRQRLYSIGAGGNPSYDAPRMRYSFGSYTTAGQLRELDPVTGRDVLLKSAEVLGDFNPANYRERRLWVRVRDGELVPVSLVFRSDRCPRMAKVQSELESIDILDEHDVDCMGRLRSACGANSDADAAAGAMFITGYGSYECSSDPGFSVARLSMLDRGVLYVVAHVRGGGEMGRAWYEQGRKLNKRNTFNDFVDVTKALESAGLADRERTVANGGSAGGLLMGAVANMAPDCYAGIEADVPFVDALTTILDPSLPLTVTEWDEWGDPLHNKDVYDYMKSYSPYENAPFGPWQGDDADEKAGEGDHDMAARFPKIFITTSLNDTRVLYVEPMKWLARLQSQGVDAVARVQNEASHGGTSGRYQQWRDVSEENAWCLAVMGINS
ncbi:oligopeptidase B [Bifidobacterium bohemicum]|uniref:Oligopeptidase B n=1 Tax=Bifidobacterium bohemicum DSM 22767 TaxID=1437606 RepID=A0A086ZGZ2_9BIFI|nr:prolyl oligopeptidase family serine peptidase [Bifidobacterium bohemicum]KFI45792.1 oligopeptidase B [Bifidobacterium bohemicum DSM 22767]SCC10881.1 oligopeptidase B [Bifidobacterium bohemicum]